MEIDLHRTKGGEVATLGDFYINTNFVCHTLEDRVRIELGQDKIMKETAIPAGRYKIIIDFSNKFQRLMLHVLDVPQFTGIRIHKGNTDQNTEGCILLGMNIAGDDLITQSTEAFDLVYPQIETALNAGEEVWITITNDFLAAA
jgi:hypothetical protein